MTTREQLESILRAFKAWDFECDACGPCNRCVHLVEKLQKAVEQGEEHLAGLGRGPIGHVFEEVRFEKENRELRERVRALEDRSRTDGESYNRGRSEGQADVAVRLRKLVDPEDKERLNLDGSLKRVEELRRSVDTLTEQNRKDNRAIRNLLKSKREAVADLEEERRRTSELRTPKWRSADGIFRHAHEFDDDHLMNTVRFIERLAEEPEEVACDEDGDWVVMEDGKRHVIYPHLLAEARSRGLLDVERLREELGRLKPVDSDGHRPDQLRKDSLRVHRRLKIAQEAIEEAERILLPHVKPQHTYPVPLSEESPCSPPSTPKKSKSSRTRS